MKPEDQQPDATDKLEGEYPREDVEETEMFHPFFKRKRTWLVAGAFTLMLVAAFMIPWERTGLTDDLDPKLVAVGLAIFVCIAFLWMTEAMPLAATALLVPVLAVLFGVSDVRASLLPFSDPLIFVFFGGFALASAMSYQGVDRWIAQSLVRMGRGQFIPVACLVFAATAFLSMWMSNTATVAMMIPLALGILRHLESGGHVLGNRVFLLLGLAYSASIGGLGTIIGSPPNGIAARQMGVSFAEWMTFGVPAVAILLPSMVGILFLIQRPQRGLRIEVKATKFTFNWHRRSTLCIFAGAATCWIFGGFLAPLLGVEGSFDTLVALSAFFALVFFRVVRWRDIGRGTDWGVLLLFGGGIALSGVLRDTGASLFLARVLTTITEGWALVFLIAGVVAFVIFLTELSSNTAVAALFVPIFYSVGMEMGIEPALLIAPLALAASCAFMMPVATPPNAIVFGTGLVTQRQMMRAGVILNLSFVILLSILSLILF